MLYLFIVTVLLTTHIGDATSPHHLVKRGAYKLSAAPPDIESKHCGIDASSGDRIIGGTDAAIDQYPWLALIEYVATGIIKTFCGGALISGKYVLTAGHCVKGDILLSGRPKNVRLGEYNTKNDASEPDCVEVVGGGEDCTDGATIIPIEKVIPHPEYNPNHRFRRHDIALLRLKQLAPYSDFIRPICLPTTDLTLSLPENFKFYTAGWGAVNSTHLKANVKQHVDLPFVPMEQCAEPYTSRGVSLWQGQMCAGGEKDKDSCKGDSGGPLMYGKDHRFEIIGIVSFGTTLCGTENVPGIYTKVYEYDSWIRNQIEP